MDDNRQAGPGRAPLVSVGMPLYNARDYVRSAIDSILAQTFGDFELILSDNASTDDTPAICQEYAARDARVRVVRAERNHGPTWNFGRSFELARGTYFMWAAHDDLRDPRSVELCVRAMRANPRAVLCCTGIEYIDEEGRPRPLPPGIVARHPAGRSVRQRMDAIARASGWFDIYGLIRRDALARTRLYRPVWGGDALLTAELCLAGEVILVPDRLFRYRIFQTKTVADVAKSLAPSGPPTPASSPSPATAARKGVDPSWAKFILRLVDAVRVSDLSPVAKLGLAAHAVGTAAVANRGLNTYLRDQGFAAPREAWASGERAWAVALACVIGLAWTAAGLRKAARVAFPGVDRERPRRDRR